MAKQSGFHQVKGKVGEYSYYQQTGVVGGLVRRINQGLSEKVKTSDVFANTRLNNAEFGQAGRISKVLGMFITPKYRPMLLPFSQSKMAKTVLEAIKTDSSPWGRRNLTTSNIAQVSVEALNKVAKGDFASYGLKLTIDDEHSQLNINALPAFVEKLATIGADGVTVRLVACSPWIGTFVPGNNAYANSYARGLNFDESVNTTGEVEVEYSFRPAPSEGWPAITGNFFVLIVLPYRKIDNVPHVLQEHCTYFAFERIDGDVN